MASIKSSFDFLVSRSISPSSLSHFVSGYMKKESFRKKPKSIIINIKSEFEPRHHRKAFLAALILHISIFRSQHETNNNSRSFDHLEILSTADRYISKH